MEEQCSPLSWGFYYQEEGLEELKHSLLYSTLELEAAIISAHEEISRKDDEILQLKDLLAKIVKERDEFQVKCQELVLEKQLLLQQVQIKPHSSKQHLDCPISSGTTSNEDDNIDSSPSDCDDNVIGYKNTMPLSPPTLTPQPPPSPPRPPVVDIIDRICLKKPLPEKGQFLQAVMEAGPLLQTLLLAGPLPQWQHPPPQLNSIDIPPVTICSPKAKILVQDSCLISPKSGGFTNKRAMVKEAYDFSPSSKYQKVCSPIIIDPNM
ncbi:hypothetical protein CDL12_02807 [Handroanthus impetiginosus]|uniref:DUF1635 domain-containing protein n=1 Tax=Handroanthus impetiginosus TaxID=429701 RepID=A0A2G9I3W8_9LAMI|nr:hypothetical protein CDL12_02807 [Handroanthus impetiginosus]